MSCDSRTDMSPGSMISISTLYRAPKWYARVMSTCAARYNSRWDEPSRRKARDSMICDRMQGNKNRF